MQKLDPQPQWVDTDIGTAIVWNNQKIAWVNPFKHDYRLTLLGGELFTYGLDISSGFAYEPGEGWLHTE